MQPIIFNLTLVKIKIGAMLSLKLSASVSADFWSWSQTAEKLSCSEAWNKYITVPPATNLPGSSVHTWASSSVVSRISSRFTVDWLKTTLVNCLGNWSAESKAQTCKSQKDEDNLKRLGNVPVNMLSFGRKKRKWDK